MPAVGKSTVGVLLAKAMGRFFVDTDVFIQALLERSLQDIIDNDGLEKFRQIEQQHVCCIDVRRAVITTGGSVIYSDSAMGHLKNNGLIVHLDLPLETIRQRLTNLNVRGVVMRKGQSLDELYAERMPLYRKWADVVIDCRNKTHEQIVCQIVNV